MDERKPAACGVWRVIKADAETVRQATGFAIGGVPPVGHRGALRIYMDRDLLQHDVVFAAAGTPNAVFSISPGDLERLTGAPVIDLGAS